jgi:pimeloyl-ACP methyl ester carboxylesterase
VPQAHHSHRRRLAAALASVITALAALLTATAAQPARAQAGAAVPVPVLTWADCGNGFQCASAIVPLDYTHPHDRRIQLALTRLPATDAAHRAGAVFVNPGGPGISGVTVVRNGARQIFTPDVRARYDIVGFDPRGVGDSTPVRCFATNTEAQAFWAATPIFPITASQERVVAATARAYTSHCQHQAGDLLRHVSTADTARDMDLLRAAIGDTKLTYWGLSYGSYLGEVYANLFPDRIRAMVLDGVVDPRAWAERTVDFLTSEAVAGGQTLDSFLTECASAGAPRCAFAEPTDSTAAGLRHRLQALLARVRQAPIPVPGSQPPQPITYQDLIGGLQGAMSEPGSWSTLAQALHALEHNDPTGAAALHALGIPPNPPTPSAAYNNVQDASMAVFCTDTDLPHQPQAWPQLAARAARQAPLFAPIGLYTRMSCATWPTSPERYTGPWNRHTSAPILLVTVTGDPDTPYSGALQAGRELANARILTVDGYGHTSVHAASGCALRAENQYLLTGNPPPADTHCPVDYTPF